MNRFRGGYWGYVLAILITAAILGLRLFLNETLERQFPFALFLVAVVVAAWSGGLKPGLFALALGLAAGIYFYSGHEELPSPQVFDRVRTVLFILVGGLVSVLMESLQVAQRRLEARQSQLAEQEERLAVEMQKRQQMEIALAEREERFRMAVESADIGTWELNVLTGQRQWSDRSRAIFGAASNEDLSKLSFLELVHPEDRERTRRAIRAALDPTGNGRYDIDYRILWPDGTVRWVVGKGQAFFDGEANDRRAVRSIGTVLDITDRKEMEESLREADRRKDEFLAILAHELRNPVAPLKRALQIWSSIKNEPAELAPLRAIMHRQVEQLIRLVDDLLDVARITQGRFELRKHPVDLATLISGAVETLQPLIEESGHWLTVSLPVEPTVIDGDSARLIQVFSNILHNAIKFTGRNGAIEITAKTEGEEVLIAVRDNGIGIARHMLPDIFAAFRQIETSPNGAHKGLGIGLNLAMRIVEMHGGTVEARSDGPGQGSEFLVTLPIARLDDRRRQVPDSGERSKSAPRRRILVVDDVQASAETLAAILRSRGQDVAVAFDGPSAIEAVLTKRPDVVFLDIGMPGMDGYEVARRLRVKPELNRVVLVALTGYGDREASRKSIEAGFDRHIIKTADIDQLEAVFFAVPGEVAAEV